MSEEDLIPMNKRSKAEVKELGRKGGSTFTEKNRLANLITVSKQAKCGRCKANCVLKDSNKKGELCPIPEVRGRAIFYDKPIVDKGILERFNDYSLIKLYDNCKSNADLFKLRSSIMEQMRTEHPQVQTSVSLSAEVSELSLEDDFANFKKLQIKWEQKTHN